MEIGGILLALAGQRLGRALTGDEAVGTGGLSIANRPLLEHAAEALATAGVTEVVVVATESLASTVRAAVGHTALGALRVRHVEVPYGAGAHVGVLAARQALSDGPVIVHADDSLVLGDLRDALRAFRDSACDLVQIAAPAVPLAPVHAPGDAVALTARPRPVGVQVIGGRALAVLSRATAVGAARTLEDLAQAVRDAGGRVLVHEDPCAWRYAGDVESYLEVNRLALDRLCDGLVPPGSVDRRPDARAIVHPDADVRGSTLRGPLLVGPGAIMRDSYVGPYTCIAGGVRLEGVEIESSVVLPDACIDHVGVRIEDSVIGAGARVHRRFTRPTALRMHVGPGAHISFS